MTPAQSLGARRLPVQLIQAGHRRETDQNQSTPDDFIGAKTVCHAHQRAHRKVADQDSDATIVL